MKKIIVLFTLLLAMQHHSQAVAEGLMSNAEFKVRIGYSIGGTAPIGIPATIRSIDSYKLTPSFMIGVEGMKTVYSNWGVMIGFHMENKGMDAEATTKAYRMEVKKGESVMNGLYTGHVKQKVTEWMFTVPIQATYKLSNRVLLKAGPYLSLLVNKDFSGYVYDGYLRQGDPTGPKVSMGTEENERATYDFSDDMRNLQMGIGAGVDWQVHKNIGVSADLNWGLNGIFKKDFKTVEQTLYPIYGTISAFYKF
ncbi:MAG: PorT family protein [Prevotella sp.]|jgi:hypothetical protein|nr:PorT family protein [Prevotella sp.]MBQ1667579.1 PorT family protein [Prevotella sp.]MBQ2214750.1 PorT family protein [Prevotella sp.]MBQ2524357.1 PorT family protein [Prevotella sp.]MBQ5377416.1 PorT family protein [Prevotella sp.]